MVITDVNQVVYQGNGSNTAFPFTFRIIDATDIQLLLIDEDGTETDITSDYFVDINTNTVHYPGYAPGSAPAEADQPAPVQTGQKLMIYRKLPITQEKDLGDKWPFYMIELGLDKLTMILQDIWDWCGRCLQVSRGQVATAGDNFDPTIPLEVDKVICGNKDGTGFDAREAMMEVNGAWDGEGRQIHGVADPTSDQDAVTKKYADMRMDNNFMKIQSDGSAWEARNLPISNVAGPASVKDAANKDYVDRILAGYSGQGDRFVFFDNVAQMQAAELVPSQMAVTLGYHDVNDGGAGVYTIRDKGADTPDGGSIIEIPGTDYVAELLMGNTASVKQFGAKGDNVTDDYDAFFSAITYISTHGGELYIPKGAYYIGQALKIAWNSNNYWLRPFDQCKSFKIIGDGIFQSVLRFDGKDGLHLDASPLAYQDNTTSIELKGFSIENPDFDPTAQSGNEREPDDSKGIGLLIDIAGYTSRVTQVAVRGFYIGIASRHCYGGPVYSNCFTRMNVFGFSSKNDTTIQLDSCTFEGDIEAGYIQRGSKAVLTNCVAEGSLTTFFKNNNNNGQREKFEGRGFVFFACAAVLNGCHGEGLFGNCFYSKDSQIIANSSSMNSDLDYYIPRAASHPEEGYQDLAQWLEDNPSHNYCTYYMECTAGGNKVIVNNVRFAITTACVNISGSAVRQSFPYLYTDQVEFNGVPTNQGIANTLPKYYKGNARPKVIVAQDEANYNSNFELVAEESLGRAKFVDDTYQGNWIGNNSFTLSRVSNSYDDSSIDEVGSKRKTQLDGKTIWTRYTAKEGSTVSSNDICTIDKAGKIKFNNLDLTAIFDTVHSVLDTASEKVCYVKNGKQVIVTGYIVGTGSNQYGHVTGLPKPIDTILVPMYDSTGDWSFTVVNGARIATSGNLNIPSLLANREIYHFSVAYLTNS